MTKEMVLKNEVLSFEELEKVSGGTVGELKDLTNALVSNPFFNKLGKFESHVPGVNRIVADSVEKVLQEDLKIDADISLGLFGTGAGSKNNSYRDMKTNQFISHAEVLDRIKKFAA